MDKFVKQGLEFGAGMTYMTMDALNKALKKLEKEGKINRRDSEKLVRDTVRGYQAMGSKYARQMESQVGQFIKKNPWATKKDIENLQAQIKRIDKLIKKYTK